MYNGTLSFSSPNPLIVVLLAFTVERTVGSTAGRTFTHKRAQLT